MKFKQIIDNINWLLSFTNKKKAKFIIWPILTIAYTLGTVLITSIISAYVIYVFSQPLSYLHLSILLFLCFSIGLISWLKNRLNTRMFWENIYLRMVITASDALSFLSEPYELSLDKERQEMRQASIHYGFEDDNSGVAMFFPELVSTLSSLISLIVITILTSKLSIIFPLVIIVTVIAAFYVMTKYIQVRNSLNKNKQELYLKNDYYNRVSFSDKASQLIRVYNYSAKLQEKIQNSSNKIEELESLILKKRLINTLSLQALALIRMAVIYGILIWMGINNKISITDFTFYFTICANIEILTGDLWKNGRLFLSANADLTIGREYIDQSKEYCINHPQIQKDYDKTVSIEFSHVYFKYPNSFKYTIEDFNLKIDQGEHLALIGKNGAGKSTLMLLLMGYLTPTQGQILIDGKPTKANERKVIFSTMFQDNIVLATTINNNVTMFNTVSQEKLERIYRKTGLKNILGSSLTGDDMLTKYIDSTGVELSGGETESLMLARMLCKKASAYILDEPSASLDALKEKKLYTTIENLTHQKTVIFISHRLASISLSDNICLLADGKIEAYGKHPYLLKHSQEYKKLYESQSKYYKEGGAV